MTRQKKTKRGLVRCDGCGKVQRNRHSVNLERDGDSLGCRVCGHLYGTYAELLRA